MLSAAPTKPADERAGDGHGLQGHAQAHVGEVLAHVGGGRRGRRGHHRDQARGDGVVDGHAQKERERRDDEDAPAQADHGPEGPADEAHDAEKDHVRQSLTPARRR